MQECSPDDQTVTSRIHRDDIVRVLQVSMDNPVSNGQLLNLADDIPSTRFDVLPIVTNIRFLFTLILTTYSIDDVLSHH